MKIFADFVRVFCLTGNIGFHAHNRFDASSLSLLIEIHSTKHIAMISDGHLLHPQFAHFIHEIFDANRAI